MSEIELYNPRSKRTSVLHVERDTRVLFSTENVHKISGNISYGTKESSIRLVTKNVSYRDPEYTADMYIDTWERLKRNYLPVVNTVRKVSHNTVAITDLSADGSVLYDKYMSWRMSEIKPHRLDRVFAKLDIAVIRHAAMDIIDQAIDRMIALPVDDPLSLVLHPSGIWNLVVLDIAKTEFDSRAVFDINRDNLKKFMQDIAVMQKYI